MKRSSDRRRLTARWGEGLAARWLQLKGMTIVERNWRCRLGEIDLVCREGDTLVFVEVKTRLSGAAGSPQEAVDGRKRARLVQLAQSFLVAHRLTDVPCRFDVVAIRRDRTLPRITHLRSAFRADGA